MFNNFKQELIDRTPYIAPFRFLFERISNLNNTEHRKYDLYSLSLMVLLFINDGQVIGQFKTFSDIADILSALIKHNYNEELNQEELQDLTLYVVHTILRNGGDVYQFDYSTLDKVFEKQRVKLLKIVDGKYYELTEQGMTLIYLTKEVQMSIEDFTITQFFFTQQVENGYFDNARDALDKIQHQMNRLRTKIKDMVDHIRMDVSQMSAEKHASIIEEMDYLLRESGDLFKVMQDTVIRKKNEFLEVLRRVQTKENRENAEVITDIEKRLALLHSKHGDLISDFFKLEDEYDRALKSQFRITETLNYEKDVLDKVMTNNLSVSTASALLAPLFGINLKKTFNVLRVAEPQTRIRVSSPAYEEPVFKVTGDSRNETLQKALVEEKELASMLRYLLESHLNGDRFLSEIIKGEFITTFSLAKFFWFVSIVLFKRGTIDLLNPEKKKINSEVEGKKLPTADIAKVIIGVCQELDIYKDYRYLDIIARHDKDKVVLGHKDKLLEATELEIVLYRGSHNG